MAELIPLLTKDKIADLVQGMAKRISADYLNHDLVLVSVLKGSFIFLSDLVRNLSIPVRIDFVWISSYGSGTQSTGQLILKKEVEIDVKGTDVLVVEDIVDTGLTMEFLIDYLNSLNPRSVKICSFLDKRERRKADIHVEYGCHVVQSGFLVGYGLDHAENYRALPGIYQLKL
ncbi:MAG: hypoxanthine phosphoribosyltransferase [Thermodesulfobacteriota bacterium]